MLIFQRLQQDVREQLEALGGDVDSLGGNILVPQVECQVCFIFCNPYLRQWLRIRLKWHQCTDVTY